MRIAERIETGAKRGLAKAFTMTTLYFIDNSWKNTDDADKRLTKLNTKNSYSLFTTLFNNVILPLDLFKLII